MHSRLLATTSLLFLCVLSTDGFAQPVRERPGMQPRDRRATEPPRTGTATITGRVTAADTGTPLRRVQARLSSPELRGGRSTMTDAEGRYTLSYLPAGRYGLTFVKAGFVTTQYGQKRPRQPGTPIDLGEGQKVERIDVALARGGVIAGRVFDDLGEPVVDARVQVMQYRWANGRRRLAAAGRVSQTNDRGEFRVWGLAPGEYYVMGTNSERPMFSDAAAAPASETDATGYAPTYYPGTASAEEAQRVPVTTGQDVTGVDFTLLTTRTVSVSGIALQSDGRPMSGAMVMLMLRSGMEGAGPFAPQGSRTDARGTFTIRQVPPGDYVLQARSSFGPPEEAGTEPAMMPVSVGAEDLKNVVLVATPGVRVSGRVIVEGTPPASGMDDLRVMLAPIEGDIWMPGMGGSARVTAQRTFEARGVQGRRRMLIPGLPTGWTLKAVRIGGTDVIDTGYEFGKEDVTGVEMVVTGRITELTGNVRGHDKQAVTDYVVMAFSTDSGHWVSGSRRIGTARPDQNSTYRLRALPPGSYYVIALEAMPEDWGNPELLETLKDRATKVRLDEGETRTLELTLEAMPPTLP